MNHPQLPPESEQKQQDFYLKLRDKVINWFEKFIKHYYWLIFLNRIFFQNYRFVSNKNVKYISVNFYLIQKILHFLFKYSSNYM